MLTEFALGGYARARDLISASLIDIEDTTPVLLIPAQGKEQEFYLTTLLITNSNENISTVVKLTEGLDGPVKWRGNATKEGGFALVFPAPLMFKSNTPVYVVCETTEATVQVSASGFKA